MQKALEIATVDSCWNKAAQYEQVFVLLERDPAMPATIRFWCEERIRLGKNEPNDHQISEALQQAAVIEIEREYHRAKR